MHTECRHRMHTHCHRRAMVQCNGTAHEHPSSQHTHARVISATHTGNPCGPPPKQAFLVRTPAQVHEITATSLHSTTKPPIPPIPQFPHRGTPTPSAGPLPVIVPPSPTPSSTVPHRKPGSPPGVANYGPRSKHGGRRFSASAAPPPSPHNPHSRQHVVPRGSKEALTQELQQ
eukprot:1140696-Pelagomonas_calceolata.AAC.1